MARWNTCNVLSVGADASRVWQFDGRKSALPLTRDQTVPANQPLPARLAAKSWTSLWQPKLNIAWLPPEHVFLRVAQMPRADYAETRTMVEFQLEKLSPLPVTQIVWSIQWLSPPAPARGATAAVAADATKLTAESLQTVIVVIVSRDLVEKFLGRLERDGFLADRLEVPSLDQLLNPATAGDGAWIYLDGDKPGALVAWRQGGVLQSLGFIHLPKDKSDVAALRDQLTQMTWAGELEGWLTTPPRWQLVADKTTALEWDVAFIQALETPIATVAALGPAELAAATARRARLATSEGNLLPVEFTARYKDQLFDRLWLRGLGATLFVYLAAVVVYWVALLYLQYQTSGVEADVEALKPSYTTAVQLKARHQILKERQDLKFAALDCWKATAGLLPSGATLTALDFRDGSRLALNGTAPSDQVAAIIDFNSAMRKYESIGQPGQAFFSKVEPPRYSQAAGAATITWDFTCALNRVEEER